MPAVSRRDSYHHGDLRAALIDVAEDLVAERGAQAFSLAEASRRAGVSVGAPYRHFADRDELMAAVGVRGYEALGAAMRLAASSGAGPVERLARASSAYVRFAAERPQSFDLLFGAGLDKRRHPSLLSASEAVYRVLLEPARALSPRVDPAPAHELAVAVGVIAHGYATALRDGFLGATDLAAERAAAAVRAVCRGRRLLWSSDSTAR